MMSDPRCPDCGADPRFDERCNIHEHGRKAERADIVAWLRKYGGRNARNVALHIERGDHEDRTTQAKP
jgi:hypothetical protein